MKTLSKISLAVALLAITCPGYLVHLANEDVSLGIRIKAGQSIATAAPMRQMNAD